MSLSQILCAQIMIKRACTTEYYEMYIVGVVVPGGEAASPMSKYHRPMLLSLTNCPASISLERSSHLSMPAGRSYVSLLNVFSGAHIVLMNDDPFHFEEG